MTDDLTGRDERAPAPRVRIETHDELVEKLPALLARLNAEPARARLLLVNPLFVLEELGVTLSDALEDHVRRTLGFPKGRMRRIFDTRRALRELLAAQFPGRKVKLPRTPRERASLVFEKLCLPYRGPRPDALTVEQLRPLRGLHPIVTLLYELGRLERGALQYQTRGEYERHKAGVPHHSWITSLQFRKGT